MPEKKYITPQCFAEASQQALAVCYFGALILAWPPPAAAVTAFSWVGMTRGERVGKAFRKRRLSFPELSPGTSEINLHSSHLV